MVEAGLRKRTAYFNPDSSKSVIEAILRHYDKQQIKFIWRKLYEYTIDNNE